MDLSADDIKNIRTKADLTQQEFADAIGVTRELLNKMESGKRSISKATALLIQDFLNKKSEQSEQVSHETHIVNEPESFLQKRFKQKNHTTGPYLVPLVPVKAQAGYVRAYDQETYIDTLEKYALPPGVNPQGAVWRYWEIEGDSMEPAFHNKDIILTSQVHQFDWENIRNFYLYVIVTPEKVLFKRVYAKNELEWVLISENEDLYEQQLLPIEFVKEVWVYRRSIVSKAPPTKMFEIKV